jgi:alpha-amylase
MKNSFTPVAWAHNTNIYEVNIRQYSHAGTLNAFAEHLPRLKDMGVETLWFMPLQPIGKLNRKGALGSYYSISNYVSLNPEYGILDDFKLLVEEAHRYNMKVIIDWVANHTSWDHVWTQTHPGFFSKNEYGDFRPPYPDWADVIHLNYENKELWLAMVNAMKFWVKNFDIDGFRCDMAHLVPLDFWEFARTELDNEKKLFWLAETEEPNYHEVFDASYTWEFLHAMESYWKRETNIHGLDAVLRRYENAFPKNAIRMFFTSNHDENSHSGSEYERMGNAAKAFAVLCATWNGIPMIYSGQELPNSQRLRFFEKDEIQWTGNFGLHNFYKTLLELHRDHPALCAADENVRTYRISTSEDEKIFSYMRKTGEREVLVILNLSAIDDLHFEISGENVSGVYRNVFTGDVIDLTDNRSLAMKAWDYLVFEK